MKRTRTSLIENKNIARDWHLVDAPSDTFGRAVVKVAGLLMGKHKVTFSKHQDIGDFVVVTNVKKLKVTGNKLKDKKYYRHSWYIGSIKERTLEQRIEEDAQKLFQDAVRRMLPKNKLTPNRLKRLKMFNGAEHTFEAELKTKK